jgi:hypothetical protein
MIDRPPQADEQTRNQIADGAIEDVAAPKVKSEKECM